MSALRKVLISGAGIGGLTAGLALIRRGFDVEIYEQANVIGEVGAGVQISSNGTRVLHALGLGDAVRRVAWEPEGKVVRLWSTGKTWKLFDLSSESVSRYGFPYLMFHRSDLIGLLLDAVLQAAPQAIRLGHKVIDVHQNSSGATIRFQNGESASGDVLIGADGIHSTIRQALFGKDRPSVTGLMAWRGVIPAAALPQHLLQPVGANWVGPGRHVIQYRLRQGTMVNFVGIVERDDVMEESWSSEGTREECAADFKNWHNDIHTMIRNISRPFKWPLMTREPMESWSAGRTTLLGDACHATLPFLAQGAVMALEDGYIVADCLDTFDDAETALKAYERLRHARTAAVMRGSAANAKRFHNPDLAEQASAEAYIEREWQPEKVRERYEWLFSYDATKAASGAA